MAGDENALCLLCDKVLNDGRATRTLSQAALNSCVVASGRRKDLKHVELKKYRRLEVHDSCAKNYTYEREIRKYVRELESREQREDGPATNTRQSGVSLDFDFESLCIFCAKDASDQYIQTQNREKKERRDIIVFANSNSKRKLLEKFSNSANPSFLEFLYRINSVDDLVQVRARYHDRCQKVIYRDLSRESSVTSSESPSLKAARYIAKYLVEHKHLSCQFSMNEILKDYQEGNFQLPTLRYLKEHLKGLFGDDIIIHSSQNGPIITFADVGKKLLTDQWYSRKLSDEKDERLRVVEAASQIILQDIKSHVYDTKSYPAPDRFHETVESDVPKTLKCFITSLVTAKKKNPENFERKILSICHAIIALVRPRSYLSSLQVGLAATLMKQYGSRELIQILNALGFCSSYEETQLLHSSILNHDTLFEYMNSYVQFVFDNADHNVNTIDGKNTFHSMGGIEIVTPASSVNTTTSMERVKKIPSSRVIGNFGRIHLKHFNKGANAGFGNILVQDLNTLKSIDYDVNINETDFFWLCAKNRYGSDFDGWNGFMQRIYSSRPFDKSKIIFLPFINAPPSNFDTIYTALLEADKRRIDIGQKHTFITFEQPLYYKAREIAQCCKNELSGVVVRLGGFHLLMSFMGSIGFIMEGSGLRELFCQIYAENSVDKIMKGHAYARAVRGHLLIHLALTNVLLSSFDLSASEEDQLKSYVTEEDNILDVISSAEFQSILAKFHDHINIQKSKGPTSKLWLQYYDTVTLMRQFIEAERSANWNLHLETIRKMIPYFYCSGHFLYAKSAQLYLQDMYHLEEMMNVSEFDKFTKQGYFAIRRSDKFWCGVWSDLTIEQMLMRSMKTRGGLTHGRGVTDAVLAKWVLTMPALTEISDFIQSFCDVSIITSEQHVDSRSSRRLRDAEDLTKVMNFFDTFQPLVATEKIHCITSGVQGDSSINCHLAYEVGFKLMQDVIGTSLKDLKFQRKNRVSSLCIVNSVKTKNEGSIVINPNLIFQRISVAMESSNDLRKFLSHELAPYPLSLFDNHTMRKTEKSKLYDSFKEPATLPDGKCRHIIDGGFLLHKIVWPKNETFESILNRYVEYVGKFYSSDSFIIFDGYPEDLTRSTKNSERMRREAGQLCADVDFDLGMIPTVAQNRFLSNSKNKVRFIRKLCDKLHTAGFTTSQAPEDADYLIVRTAVDVSSDENISIIVAEDVDILIIMTQMETDKKVFLLKPSRNSVPQKIFDKHSCSVSETLKKYIGFIHAFTGCDTTSALFSFGKLRVVNALKKYEELLTEASIFYEPNASPELVERVGMKILCYLYGGKRGIELDLNELRYRCFKNNCKRKNFNLASLPPTEAAAKQHCRRAYLQLQAWIGRDVGANSWGWSVKDGILQPKYTDDSLVPEDLLRIISCNCRTGCSKTCGCVKHGLRCSEYCANCHGETCKNHAETYDEVDLEENDDDDEISNMIEQQMQPDLELDESDETENVSDSDDETPYKKLRKM